MSQEHETALYGIYPTLAGQYHPDVSAAPEEVAEIRLRKIEDAYEVLRDKLRNVAPEAASPSRRDQLPLRQSQATLSGVHKKGRPEPFVFVVILVILTAALCNFILDIQHWMAMAPLQLSNPIALFDALPRAAAESDESGLARRPECNDVAYRFVATTTTIVIPGLV